jgi:tetratricopeptide (TPR) repeat protein
MVARILELRGNEDEWVSLHRELLARRDGRLRDAKDALVVDDIARACAAVAGSRVEDFDNDDRTLVQHLLACAGIATPLAAAILAERCDDDVAAATALQAIPEPSRGGVVPGRSETIAEFLARMLRNLHRETQRQERRTRHAAQRKKIAELRADREVRGREIIEACTTAGIAADQTRCEVETTVGPIVVVIRRSLSPSCTLWFATAVRARAFDAAAVQASEDGGGGESFRIVSDVAPPGVNEIFNSMTKGSLGAERQHDLLVAIDWPAWTQAPPAVVFNAGPGLWRSTIGWIDQDASANALAAFRRFGNLRCDAPGSLLGVVKTVRLAAPPLCWDLTPQLQLGADLAEQSRWEESVAAFEAAVAHDPHDAKAWMGIAHGLKQLGRFKEGVEAMERAFAANPKVAVFLYNSACYHAMAGHAGRAIEVLAKAIAMKPKWRETAKIDSDFTAIRRDKAFLAVIGDREPARRMEADLKQGVALADRGRCEEAVATLRSLTERHAHLTEAWVAIGRCLKKLGLPSDAATAMRQGLEASRGHPRLWYNLACYASLAGQDTAALQALMTAISLYPEYAEAAAKDRDLDPVRSDPRFAVILAAAKSA